MDGRAACNQSPARVGVSSGRAARPRAASADTAARCASSSSAGRRGRRAARPADQPAAVTAPPGKARHSERPPQATPRPAQPTKWEFIFLVIRLYALWTCIGIISRQRWASWRLYYGVGILLYSVRGNVNTFRRYIGLCNTCNCIMKISILF